MYIYICVCVRLCVCIQQARHSKGENFVVATLTCIYNDDNIDMFIHIYMCLCVSTTGEASQGGQLRSSYSDIYI